MLRDLHTNVILTPDAKITIGARGMKRMWLSALQSHSSELMARNHVVQSYRSKSITSQPELTFSGGKSSG